jgi:hypothetical protein
MRVRIIDAGGEGMFMEAGRGEAAVEQRDYPQAV